MEGESLESAAAGAGQAADPAGIALALGAAAHNERVAAKAEAFLEKQAALSDRQSVLVELQAEELRREIHLHHWSLRIRHVSGVLKLAFEFAVAFIVLAIAALIANAIWDAAHDRGLVIEAFEVPPDLASRGLTGEVVASQLLDKLAAMQDATQTVRPAQSYANNWGNDIKVQIPDTGISIGELNHYLRNWLGHETHIAGEVYHSANKISVTARVSGGDSASFSGPESALDALLQKAAENIYKQTQPYRYTAFLVGNILHVPASNWNEARQILIGLTQDPDSEERAWAWLGLANVERFHDSDTRRSLADFHRALLEKPEFGLALLDSAEQEGALGHNEAFLVGARKAIAIYKQAWDSISVTARIYVLSNEPIVDAFLGDFGAQIADSERGVQFSSIPGITAESWRDSIAGGFASQHDGKAARGAFRSLPPLPAPDISDRTNRVQAEFQMDVALGNWRAALAEEPSAEKMQFFGYPGLDNYTVIATQFRPWLALARAETGDMSGARAAIDTTPGDCYDCVRVRGKIAALAHRWRAAAWWFAIATKQGPSIPFAYSDWGEMLLHKGDYGGAIAKFAVADQKGPHFADPLEMWGEALMQENRSDVALAKFSEANKYAPNWGRLHLEWGEALMYLGRRAEAQQQFAVASHLDLSTSDAAALAQLRGVHA